MEAIDTFNNILRSFKIKAACVDYKQVDNYFYFDLRLNPSARLREIQKYSDEISLALKAPCKPSLKMIREEGIVRLEFAAPRTSPLRLIDLFKTTPRANGEISCLLGQTVDGQKLWMDLAQNPHLLVAGTTGSGKSILLQNIIANLLKYNDVDIFLSDPKRIEFSAYENRINNIDVVYSYDATTELLAGLLEVMEDRYLRLRSNGPTIYLKPMVLIIDEFADLIMQDRGDMFYTSLCKLAQKCRAAKIHIILATQRPSTNIVSGVIKANFPARIACRVASHVDSKVILDSSGAESLLGKGDALIRDNFRSMERFQVAYTDATEVCSTFGA